MPSSEPTMHSRLRTPAARRLLPRPTPLALAACALLGWSAAHAQTRVLPTGLTVASGQATLATSNNGNRLTITNSNNAILNWNSFSIGSGQSVYFQQPGSASQVLNRVTGQDPSQILGSLGSNGRVWLLNPNGVLFGQNAVVDVGGLVVSTLRLNDADWLGGRFKLGDGSGLTPAAITNQGTLRTTLGGQVVLVGGTVQNEGLISTPGGQLVLAAGQQVELVDTGAPNLSVKLSVPDGQVRNLGTLSAEGGRIDLHAAVVNQQGVVRADALASGPAGEILITARDSLNLAAGSSTSANGATDGGRITLDGGAAGTAMVEGTLSATSSSGTGGQVSITGQHVGLAGHAVLDVSGSTGGGGLRIGGGDQGKDASLRNAQALFVGSGVRLSADALGQGDGGRIVLWSDNATRAYGQFSAQGGRLGGNGGWLETSGGWLDARPAKLSLSAPLGRAGTWLLDPSDITIISSASLGISQGTAGSTVTFSGNGTALLDVGVINTALNAGQAVVVETSSGTGGTGQITVASTVLVNVSNPTPNAAGLKLQAASDIVFGVGSGIQATGSSLNVTLQAGGKVVMDGTTIQTGGSFTAGGNTNGVLPGGGTFTSAAWNNFDSVGAISLSNSSILASSIDLRGVGMNTGVDLNATNLTATGAITLTGQATGIAPSSSGQAFGVRLVDSIITSATGAVTVLGMGADVGIGLSGGNSFNQILSGGNGDVILTGRGQGVLPGVRISGRSVLQAQGSGGVSIVGANLPSLAASSGDKAVILEQATDISGPTVSAGTSGSITVQTFDTGRNLSMDNTTLTGGNLGGTITVSAPGTTTVTNTQIVNTGAGGAGQILITGGSTVDFFNTSLSAKGTVQVNSDQYFVTDSTVTSQASGTAILLAGYSTPGMASFLNSYSLSSPAQPLNAPNGRWIVYTQDSTSPSFSVGQFNYDFKRYGSALNGWSGDVGNGIVSVAPQTAVITATGGGTKTYDGTVNTTLTGVSAFASFTGDTGSAATAAATFADKNAAIDKLVTIDPNAAIPMFDSNGKPAYGYTFSGSVAGAINPLALSVSGAQAANKVYNGTTAATVTSAGSVTLLPGDSATLGGTLTASFADKNVGTAKPVSITGYTLTGNDAGNYTVAPAVASADITPLTLPVTGLTVFNKVYNANTTATVTGTAAISPVSGDQVVLSGTAVGSFADKNVANGKPVSTSGLSLVGSDAGNYSLQLPTLSANITPLTVSINGITPVSKVYDGTTVGTVTGTPTAGVLPGDSVVVQGTPVMNIADKNVGSNKSAIVNGYTLSGPDAGNYSVGGVFVRATITPLPIAVTGATVATKTYDGTTAATLTNNGSITPIVGDSLVLQGTPVASFADKNAGAGKTVTISGYQLSGLDQLNYTLTAPTALGTINPLVLIPTGATVASKVYDGSALTQFIGTPVVTGLPGDVVALSGTPTVQFTDKNVGTAKQAFVTGWTLTGTDARNYAVNTSSASLVGNITPATLTYTATAASREAGLPPSGLTGNVSGFVAGETLASSTTGNLVFTTPADASSAPGSYAINGGGLLAANYQFVQAAANATALTLTQATTSTSTAVQVDTQKVIAQVPPVVVTDVTTTGLADLTSSLSTATAPVTTTSTIAAATTTATTTTTTATTSSTSTSASSTGTSTTGTSSTGTSSSSTSGSTTSGTTTDTTVAAAASTTTTQRSATSTTQGTATDFAPKRLDSLSSTQMLAFLAGRAQLKDQALAGAVQQLTINPAQADVQACQSLEEARRGTCLLTDALRQQARAGVTVSGRATPSSEAAPAAAPVAAPAAAVPAAVPVSPQAPLAPVVATAPAAPAAGKAVPAEVLSAAAQTMSGLPASVLELNLVRRKVRTAALPQIERKVALVIGVSQYRDTAIPSLGNAVKDAKAVSEVFERKLGYETVMLQDASKASVVAALNQLALELKPSDSLVIYYAGHGELVEATKQGYWLLADSSAQQPASWLSNSDISRLVAQFDARQVALISDSCYSGSLASEERLRASPGMPDPAQLLQRKSVVVMSSGGNEPVFDEGKQGHSPFAWNLMATLNNVATWQPGGNVFERVRFAVARELPQRPQYSASRSAGHQAGGDYLFERRQLDTAN